jgi:multidrug resistance efflux pump
MRWLDQEQHRLETAEAEAAAEEAEAEIQRQRGKQQACAWTFAFASAPTSDARGRYVTFLSFSQRAFREGITAASLPLSSLP